MEVSLAKKSAFKNIRKILLEAIYQNNAFIKVNKKKIDEILVQRILIRQSNFTHMWKEELKENTIELHTYELAQRTRKINRRELQRLLTIAINDEKKALSTKTKTE